MKLNIYAYHIYVIGIEDPKYGYQEKWSPAQAYLLTGFAHADARGGTVQWREVQFAEEYVIAS